MRFIFVSYSPRYTYCWYSCALRFVFDIHVTPWQALDQAGEWLGSRRAGCWSGGRRLTALAIFYLPACSLAPRGVGTGVSHFPLMQKLLCSLGGTADSRQSDAVFLCASSRMLGPRQYTFL
ncbi:unnamed protein product [Rangifer tarandus platyrhynchus]|uniref:Uncharacterized protein n=2 Tax=Rangifer tarandus platyrhynchus TaxID=3082113 RepID=A0ABN8XUS5_RANTA|nr:unnamed protein product [Rangifer tarandus platyrhynchus]